VSTKFQTTHNKILETTIDLLKNSQNVSPRMADIAKKAGVSRQALYLHFKSRTELLIEVTHHIDNRLDLPKRIEKVYSANDSVERLDRYIEFWANYVPEVYKVGKTLLAEERKDTDAAAAWADRMNALLEGCTDIMKGIETENKLSDEWKSKEAGQYFWILLSVPSWEQMTIKFGWSKKKYITHIKKVTHSIFLK